MAVQAVPTKGNLMTFKKSLALAKNGYELLDKKRNILVREMMTLIDRAAEIQDKIDVTYSKAYLALQKANITLGYIDDLAKTIPADNSLKLSYRSVMGVEIPIVTVDESEEEQGIFYGLGSTNEDFDDTGTSWKYRLADAIKKTQKRANALKNIMIPRFEETVKFITDALDEKDREEFSRLKVIKAQKNKTENE